MLRNASLTVLAAMSMCSVVALAKAPAAAPAGTTGLCKDGTYTSAASKSGACSGHDGIKKWYGAPAEAGTATSSTGGSEASSKTKAKTEAAAPATAGAATGTCKDGSTTSATSKSGACSGHGGVKEWYAAAGATAPVAAAPMSKAAPAAAGAPAGAATGMCKDGTSTSAASKRGACSGHGGVKEWYAAAGATVAAVAPASASMPASPAAAPAKTSSYTPPATPAPGGGAGQVWVNTSSKVYHCPDDRWYGKTKEGTYMSEANAIAQGNRADHGKACH